MYERTTPSSRIVRQELHMSCGAACARQLLLDAGIDIPEATIRAQARFDPADGTGADALATALGKLHPVLRYAGGTVFPEHLDELARRAPFLALLKIHGGRHWVIVDRVEGELVFVRDPGSEHVAGTGIEGMMKLSTFLERWRLTANGTVYVL